MILLSRPPIYRNILKKLYSSAAAPSKQGTIVNFNAASDSNTAHIFRTFGHLEASINPLSVSRNSSDSQLLSKLLANCKDEPLIQKFKNIYCGNISYEFNHLTDPAELDWIINHIENIPFPFTLEDEKKALNLLLESEAFDLFMTKRFAQVKRYGLEGAETMITAIDVILKQAASEDKFDDVVIGMPHRGRLNLLVGLLEYPAEALFYKLSGKSEFPNHQWAMGDVISHIMQVKQLSSGINAILLPNPSHLEAINPVALGVCRARMESAGKKVLSLQLHGDAAFSGQGVVYESLALSNLPSFSVNGTIHLVVNNQLGFTTIPKNGRSTTYATDIAKSINAPIVHVNADHPLEVAKAAQFAYQYCQKYKKDVVVDLIGFRKWGHNELDEPFFTQPLMYSTIRSRSSIPQTYAKSLIERKVIDTATVEETLQARYNQLDEAVKKSSAYQPMSVHWNFGMVDQSNETETGTSSEALMQAGIASITVPSNATVHPRLQKYHIEARLNALKNNSRLDWATCEAFAVGTLLAEGHPVRFSGQDVGRGTFSHRHFQLYDQSTESPFVPLNNSNLPAKLQVVNSNLSEFAVMGYEYGYSTTDLNCLTIWEAQFGDFFNGAQIIIDTFLSSGETKWLQSSGLTLLLPHGYDGAGPEHSSCRVERFLQLCDENMKQPFKSRQEINMQVVNPTTPAQYFHLLRRQVKSPIRKPLIVVAPKTLLRLPAATSKMEEMISGTEFIPVIADENIKEAKKVVFVSGKIYYDLKKEQQSKSAHDVAFVRLEQLCPFPAKDISQVMQSASPNASIVYCQEECENMGAYSFVGPRLSKLLDQEIGYVGRDSGAAPATGIGSRYKSEQQSIISKCFE